MSSFAEQIFDEDFVNNCFFLRKGLRRKMEKMCDLAEFDVYSLADPEYFDWDKSFLAHGEAVVLIDKDKLGWMNPRQKIRYEGFLRTILDRCKTAFFEQTTVYYSVSLDEIAPFSIGLYGLESRRLLNAFVCEEVEDEQYWKVWKILSAYGLRLFFK